MWYADVLVLLRKKRDLDDTIKKEREQHQREVNGNLWVLTIYAFVALYGLVQLIDT